MVHQVLERAKPLELLSRRPNPSAAEDFRTPRHWRMKFASLVAPEMGGCKMALTPPAPSFSIRQPC